MVETFEQYVQRLLGLLDGKDPLEVLETTATQVSSLVSGKGEDQLRKRSAPGKWSVAEIVAHLSETEMVVGFRVRLILASNGTPIQSYDQNEWAKRYDHVSIPLALDMYRAIRKTNLALYRSLSAEQWQQFGIHSERGKETVAHIAKLHAGHDINHVKQIEGILGRN